MEKKNKTAQEPKAQEQLNLRFGKSEVTIYSDQIHCRVHS